MSTLPVSVIRYCPSYRILCKSLAFMEQFTFVSAMSWQTLIGHNNIQRLQGTSDTSPFGVKHLLAGYGLPAILSAVTATVEFAGGKCAFYKPRFGERSDSVGSTVHSKFKPDTPLSNKKGFLQILVFKFVVFP